MFNFNNLKISKEILEYLFFSQEEIIQKTDNFDCEEDHAMSSVIKCLLDDVKNVGLEKINIIKDKIIPNSYGCIFELRWKGILEIIKNNFDAAIEYYEKALKKADNNKSEKWIIKSILEDILEIEILKYINSAKKDSNKIDENRLLIDKIGSDIDIPFINNEVLKEYIKLERDIISSEHKDTLLVSFTSKYQYALPNIAMGLIYSICVGSYSMIRKIRSRIGILLYIYYKLDNIELLLLKAIEVLIIEQDIDSLKKIVKSEINIIAMQKYKKICDIINYPMNMPNITNIKIKCELIALLASYIDNSDNRGILDFLYEILKNVESNPEDSNVRQIAFTALSKIYDNRGKIDVLKKLLSKIYKYKSEFLGLLKFLESIKWAEADGECQKAIVDYIFSLLPKTKYISNFNILYNIRSANISLSHEIYNKLLETKFDETSIGFENLVYYFSLVDDNSNKERELELLKRWLLLLSKRYAEVNRSSPISIYGREDLLILINFLIKEYITIDDQVYADSFALMEKVLMNEYQTSANKVICLDAIIKLYIILNANKLDHLCKFYKEIRDRIAHVRICQSRNDRLTGFKEILELKLLLLDILFDGMDKNRVWEMYLTYGNSDIRDIKEATMNFIYVWIKSKKALPINDLKQFLYAKTFDDYYTIRGDAIFYLSILDIKVGKRRWEEFLYRRINELIIDGNSYVRSSVLYASCNRIDKGLSKKYRNKYLKILRLGLNDPHYRLREHSEEKLTNYEHHSVDKT